MFCILAVKRPLPTEPLYDEKKAKRDKKPKKKRSVQNFFVQANFVLFLQMLIKKNSGA